MFETWRFVQMCQMCLPFLVTFLAAHGIESLKSPVLCAAAISLHLHLDTCSFDYFISWIKGQVCTVLLIHFVPEPVSLHAGGTHFCRLCCLMTRNRKQPFHSVYFSVPYYDRFSSRMAPAHSSNYASHQVFRTNDIIALTPPLSSPNNSSIILPVAL